MKLVILLVALSGCHLVFGIDLPEYVYITIDGPVPTDAGDDAIDGRIVADAKPDAILLDAATPDAMLPIDAVTVDADLTTIVSFSLSGQLCAGMPATGQLQLSAAISSPFTVTLVSTQAAISFLTNTYTFQPATWSTPIDVPVSVGTSAVPVDVYVTAPDGVFILRNLYPSDCF